MAPRFTTGKDTEENRKYEYCKERTWNDSDEEDQWFLGFDKNCKVVLMPQWQVVMENWKKTS